MTDRSNDKLVNSGFPKLRVFSDFFSGQIQKWSDSNMVKFQTGQIVKCSIFKLVKFQTGEIPKWSNRIPAVFMAFSAGKTQIFQILIRFEPFEFDFT